MRATSDKELLSQVQAIQARAQDVLEKLGKYRLSSKLKISNTFYFHKPRPNAIYFSLYMARQILSIVECCREGVAKRSRLFTRLGTQHSTDVLFDE